MKSSVVAKVEGTGKVLLKMTSGMVVTLNRVSYVPELKKNLVSIPVLTKNEFKCVFVSDRVVVSKNDMYVGKDYLRDDLFKLNVIVVDMNKDFASFTCLSLNAYGMNIWDTLITKPCEN